MQHRAAQREQSFYKFYILYGMLYIILLPNGSKQILYKEMNVYVRIFIFYCTLGASFHVLYYNRVGVYSVIE